MFCFQLVRTLFSPARQDNSNGDKKTIVMLFKQMFTLVHNGLFDEIKELFESLHPEQCTKILNTRTNSHTLLYWAIAQINIDISRYLLELSLRQGRYEMCENWKKAYHPLNAALDVGNIELIQLISENLYDINDPVYCSFTPLMLAIFTHNIEYVRLMVDLGADVNTLSFFGVSPLLASTSNSNICQFLLDQGANVNYQDENGFTALHGAVMGVPLASLKVLVNGGADINISNYQGMIPLMLSAANSNSAYMIYLLDLREHHLLDTIEALEILNGCFVADENSIITGWLYSLTMRADRYPKRSLYPARELLDFAIEFKTPAELEELETKPLKLAFQAILVIERILGRDTHLYIYTILKTAMIAKHQNELDKFRQLIDYCCEYFQQKPANFLATSSQFLMELFLERSRSDELDIFFENGAFGLFKMVAQKTKEMWLYVKEALPDILYYEHRDYSNTIDMFLYMASLLQRANLPPDCLHECYRAIYILLKSDPRTTNNQSLLHRVIRLSPRENWCSLKLIRVLVECGADINSKDYFRRTPLMYALEYTPDGALDEVLEYLMEKGSHIDCKSSEGFSAMDITPLAKRVIKPRTPRTLQCLATEVILDNDIPYEEEIPKVLVEFVDMHK